MFEDIDTRRDIMGPTVVAVETAPAAFSVAPDFVDEITKRVAICWKHGDFYLNDNGVKVRLPVYAAACAGCR